MERRARWRPSNFTPPNIPLRVTNAFGSDGGAACLYLYDSIDAWGGEWGVSAAEFVEALNGVHAARLDLHLNSPGGDVFEATSMRAALVAHSATVHVFVDGIAASAASVLATVGERVVCAPGSQVMIHRANSFALGNAGDMRATADLLEKVDNDIAGFYLHRSRQGTVESWLRAMEVETWYSAEEAVTAGLADEVASRGGPARMEPEQLAPAAAAVDRWILAAYRYAGRDQAPAPQDAAAAVEEVSTPPASPAPAATEVVELPTPVEVPATASVEPIPPVVPAPVGDPPLTAESERAAAPVVEDPTGDGETPAVVDVPAADVEPVGEEPVAADTAPPDDINQVFRQRYEDFLAWEVEQQTARETTTPDESSATTAAAPPPPASAPAALPTPGADVSELIRSAVRKATR